MVYCLTVVFCECSKLRIFSVLSPISDQATCEKLLISIKAIETIILLQYYGLFEKKATLTLKDYRIKKRIKCDFLRYLDYFIERQLLIFKF